MNLVELYDIVIQAQSLNGVPLSNGHVYVYALGRTRLMDTWSDVAGESLNTNPVILDNAGQAKIYVSDAFDYTLVFTDEYDNEIFSVDKYLLSQGAHSHADVAVAPSESIAVSSYNVGEVTVYVPYLTGQLGKVYTGIEPIVVNNTEDKISANHVPLGVQDPLYFVQDDEEGCIIGFSGQTIPEGVMSESALGFENNKITGYNGSAFSAGNEYAPGDNIDITNGVISGRDWTDEIRSAANDASAAATAWTDSQGYLTGVDLSEYAKESFVISAIDSSTSGLLPTSAFATASGSFITALPDDLATTGFVAGVSSDIVSQIPSTAGLATEQWVENKGYLTAVDIPESATWNATTQTVSANSAQWAGGTANPQIPVTSTSGISIFESGDKVYFNISADYALADDLTAKQDSLTFGYKDTAISSIDESAIYDNSAHARINTLASRISDLSSNKLDESAFSDVSGTFLTAHQSLAGYATEDWVTAQGYLTAHQDLSDYQTTADMVNYQTTAAMTGYQEAGEYYSASNPSGFISEVPDTYLQNTDLSTEDGKVTAISGIPLSAGGDVPDGVMVESGLEYNAVNEISAYNGSAIAQYGAEKQWLVHDDTLVHLSNSAQYALGCNISALQRLMGIDETVLWTGSLTSSLSLSESMSSFNRVRFVMHCDNDTQINQNLIHEIEWNNGNMVTMADVVRYPATASFPIYDYRWGANIASNGKDISNVYHEMYWHAKNSWTGGGLNENAAYYPVKIIGIGRKEV